MTEALLELIADKHWPFVWPCFALCVVTFAGLAIRAALRLRYWRARAERDG